MVCPYGLVSTNFDLDMRTLISILSFLTASDQLPICDVTYISQGLSNSNRHIIRCRDVVSFCDCHTQGYQMVVFKLECDCCANERRVHVACMKIATKHTHQILKQKHEKVMFQIFFNPKMLHK